MPGGDRRGAIGGGSQGLFHPSCAGITAICYKIPEQMGGVVQLVVVRCVYVDLVTQQRSGFGGAVVHSNRLAKPFASSRLGFVRSLPIAMKGLTDIWTVRVISF